MSAAVATRPSLQSQPKPAHAPGGFAGVVPLRPPPPRPPYLDHVGTLLRLLALFREREASFGLAPTSPSLFLVRDDGASFWELIGFRMRGSSELMLAATRFPKQPGSQDPYARRSLRHYLCAPPKELGLARAARPSNLLEVWMPNATEDVPAFQSRMANGGTPATLFVDTDAVEFAFDFRIANPSIEKARPGDANAPETHLFRTVEGHVLSGVSYGLHAKLHSDAAFLALQNAVQHMPSGSQPLPTLVIHRSFVTTDAVLPLDADLGPWLGAVPLFARRGALARPLLEGSPAR